MRTELTQTEESASKPELDKGIREITHFANAIQSFSRKILRALHIHTGLGKLFGL